jgi:hypothetical protein
VLTQLERALDGLHAVRGTPQSATSHDYAKWLTATLRTLRKQVRPADLHMLLVEHRFAALRESSPITGVAGQLLREVETEERIEIFEAAIVDLRAAIDHWTSHPGALVVIDTNVFLNHPQKIRDIDYAAELGLGFEPIRIVLPIIVIDELDRRKDTGNQSQPRWRAGHTLGVLDEILRNPRSTAQLKPADADWDSITAKGGMPHGEVAIEILLDEPGHVRLPNANDEIISRALAVSAFTRRDVHLLTGDTHMATRARMTDLVVHKRQRDIGDEPPPMPPHEGRRGGR